MSFSDRLALPELGVTLDYLVKEGEHHYIEDNALKRL